MDLVSWDEFVALPDNDRRELIDGELVEVEVPNHAHDRIVARLCQFLWNWADEHDPGASVVASGYKVRITKHRGVMPDVQLFRSDNPVLSDPKSEVGVVTGRPDLAIEIISPSSVRYDRVVKSDWYMSIGVPEYWVIAPKHRILERFVARRGEWSKTDALDSKGTLRPSTFPGLEIPIGRLLDRPKRVR
jgi:Uma2 family endonuclease